VASFLPLLFRPACVISLQPQNFVARRAQSLKASPSDPVGLVPATHHICIYGMLCETRSFSPGSQPDIFAVVAEDTIITWSDPEIGTDIALSFQEAAGCDYIWCVHKSAHLSLKACFTAL
jgi:hypothetical protein